MSPVRPHGRATRNSTLAPSSRDFKSRWLKGPDSRKALPRTLSQFPNGEVERYTYCRIRFWFSSIGEIPSRRRVNCRPASTVMRLLPRLSVGVTPALKAVSTVDRFTTATSDGTDTSPRSVRNATPKVTGGMPACSYRKRLLSSISIELRGATVMPAPFRFAICVSSM